MTLFGPQSSSPHCLRYTMPTETPSLQDNRAWSKVARRIASRNQSVPVPTITILHDTATSTRKQRTDPRRKQDPNYLTVPKVERRGLAGSRFREAVVDEGAMYPERLALREYLYGEPRRGRPIEEKKEGSFARRLFGFISSGSSDSEKVRENDGKGPEKVGGGRDKGKCRASLSKAEP